MQELNKILSKIQKQLKAPKGQKNTFGKYRYRSCEDILESVKPLIPDGTVLTLTDFIEKVGDRYYLVATACIAKESDNITVGAYAREPLNKKGMDESQITGAASSYARKYALNGLFLIDDTKDVDTEKPGDNCSVDNQKQAKVTQAQRDRFAAYFDDDDNVRMYVLSHEVKEAWEILHNSFQVDKTKNKEKLTMMLAEGRKEMAAWYEDWIDAKQRNEDDGAKEIETHLGPVGVKMLKAKEKAERVIGNIHENPELLEKTE